MNRYKMFNTCVLVILIVLAIGGSATGRTKKSLGDLTGPWQLFVDDYLVAEKTLVVRNYHPFKKYENNPVLSADKPWEDTNIFVYGTVLPTEDRSGYRLWYFGKNTTAEIGTVRHFFSAYATSKDGINWEKPNLGIYEWKGSTENNMFLARKHSPGDDHNPQIIHTPWEKDPQKRYKMITFVYPLDRNNPIDEGYWGSYSPDGIHWTDVEDNPVLPDGGDVGNFTWDAHKKQYMGTPKVWATVPNKEGYRRCVGKTATKDFEHWPHTELVLVPDEIDDSMYPGKWGLQFYGLSSFAYESGYIGFLWIFRTGSGEQIYIQLVSSRDGINWTRVEPTNGMRPALLPNGPDGGWDDGIIYTSSQPLVEGDKIKLWYGGRDGNHSDAGNRPAEMIGAIGLATLRKDGFASLDAGEKTGIVTTKLLKGLRGKLYVNAETKVGKIKAEVLDADGKVIKGYSRDDCKAVSGNGIEQLITWKRHKKLPRSKKLMRLRFIMTNASLYSFKAGKGVDVAEESAVFRAFFDFEGDSGQAATDKATGDGSQQCRFYNNVTVTKDPTNACGNSALAFTSDGKTLSTFRVDDTQNLGKNFTLAAKVKTGEKRLARLFSTYRGCDKPVCGELIFDFNPAEGVVRFIANGQTVESSPQAINAFREKSEVTDSATDAQKSKLIMENGLTKYHHYAITYDVGDVKLYFDGKEVGSGSLRSGSCLYTWRDPNSVVERFNEPNVKTVAGIYLSTDLRVGEDAAGKFEIHDRWMKRNVTTGPDEQLIGFADDILVTRRTLSAEEIAALSQR